MEYFKGKKKIKIKINKIKIKINKGRQEHSRLRLRGKKVLRKYWVGSRVGGFLRT